MSSKELKRINLLLSLCLGAFTLSEVLNFPFLFFNEKGYTLGYLWAQGIYVFGLLLVNICLWLLIDNMKRGIFNPLNEKYLKYFGIAILINGVVSNMIFNYCTEIENYASRLLAFIGVVFIFMAIIFKNGKKLKEEQDLTI